VRLWSVEGNRQRLDGGAMFGNVPPDTPVTGTGVDLVADLVIPHVGPDPHHDTRDVVSEHERQLVLQEQLELAVAYHLVQRVDAGGTNPHQDVTRSDGGIRHLGAAEAVFAIFLADECFHWLRQFVEGFCPRRPGSKRHCA
jgi:hypothetical protein